MVLLIALLIWRLMERTMRRHIESENRTITGWDNRQTKRPTSFMMTTKFINTLVLTIGNQRKLARPLRIEQKEFLTALKVPVEIFHERIGPEIKRRQVKLALDRLCDKGKVRPEGDKRGRRYRPR